MMEGAPTLALTLQRCCEACGCSAREARAGDSASGRDAQSIFVWAAQQLTTHSIAAAGLYVGLGTAAATQAVREIEQRRSIGDNADRLDELLVEITAEARIWHRLGRSRPEREPDVIAHHIISGRVAAGAVGWDEIAHLAAAYLALLGCRAEDAEAVAAARAAADESRRHAEAARAEAASMPGIKGALDALRRTLWTPGEKQARADLATTIDAYLNTTTEPKRIATHGQD